MEFTLKPHLINKENFFIKGWYIDKHVCEDLINQFNCHSRHWKKGMVMNDNKSKIVKEDKDSTDLIYDLSYGFEFYEPYVKELQKTVDLYKETFPACDRHTDDWALWPRINLQRYLPGEGFHKFHAERGSDPDTIKRHLVFMTYLNTVEEGGETEFFHQNLKIKPEEGLTLIWPSEWTYLHRGLTTKNEIKYIITGWFNFS